MLRTCCTTIENRKPIEELLTMTMFKSMLKFLIACMLLGNAMLAQAGFSITGTRVIYNETDGEAMVRLQHVTGEKPVLLQVWLDNGHPDAKPGAQDLPFILTPSVSRVDPGNAQVIRIMRIRNDLPTDRETLLFFNALEVPPAVEDPTRPDESRIHLAMQARMKFFYRPKGLTPTSAQAADLLRFSLATGDDGQLQLRLYNPTPYHITLPNVALHAANAAPDAVPLAKHKETRLASMVAPFSDLSVELDELAPNTSVAQLTTRRASSTEVHYTVINDHGGINAKQATLDDAS